MSSTVASRGQAGPGNALKMLPFHQRQAVSPNPQESGGWHPLQPHPPPVRARMLSSPPQRGLWHFGLGPVPCPSCSRAWYLSLRGSEPASSEGAGSLLYPSLAPLRPFFQFPR